MFGDGASLFASPGRVNLIGEHTDYNLGFVLPGAIDKAIYVALKPNDGTVCRVYSLDYDETVELNLHGEKPSQQWACYVYGVCKEMEKRGALKRQTKCSHGFLLHRRCARERRSGRRRRASRRRPLVLGRARERRRIRAQRDIRPRVRPGTTGQDRTDDRA